MLNMERSAASHLEGPEVAAVDAQQGLALLAAAAPQDALQALVPPGAAAALRGQHRARTASMQLP